MLSNKNTLQPCFAEVFSGVIWNIKIHRSGVVAIESRNKELKKVMFSAFNFLLNETYFKEKTFEESWHLSLAYISDKNVVLNGYDRPESPENKGLMSLDVRDGTILWQRFNISLNRIFDGGIEVFDSRIQPRKLYWIDHKTGINTDVRWEEADNSIVFPQTDANFVMPGFLNIGALAGEALVLTYSDKYFLSFHEVDGSFLTQRLLVYQDDKVLIDDILNSGIQKLQPEAFFIQQNHLFYIRGKAQLIAYLV